MTRVAVLGASGYTGGEVLRLLLAHPAVEVVQATSDQFAGKRLDFPHPSLRGLGSLRFVPHDALEPCDILVSCMPQGGLIQRWARVRELASRVIDLSADFRLDPAAHERWYKKHPRPAEAPPFVYGLAEWTAEQLPEARFVAVPGCMAHAALLAILPLVRAGLVKPDLIVPSPGARLRPALLPRRGAPAHGGDRERRRAPHAHPTDRALQRHGRSERAGHPGDGAWLRVEADR
jgi:N-acetyl-gamma-glutamyl-phosphate/LysW-gamma-L-alpha-aminoadipyl-6-phosphate reductase